MPMGSTLFEIAKSKVEKILFLLDKFCVGDNFYLEITMLEDNLPWSYLVKQKRDQLNKLCHLSSTPGEEEGAQMLFKELLADRNQDYIGKHPEVYTLSTTVYKIILIVAMNGIPHNKHVRFGWHHLTVLSCFDAIGCTYSAQLMNR